MYDMHDVIKTKKNNGSSNSGHGYHKSFSLVAKMVSGTLYTYPGSFRANKIQIAAAYSGSDVKVDSDFEYGKTNTEESFLKKFPLGKVPAFQDADGNCLDQTNAIAQYVSNEELRGGSCALDQAMVQRYIEFADNEVLPSACTWTFPTLGFKQYNKQDTEKAQTQIKKCLAVLNDELLTKTFLVGERITLADISMCCNLVMLYVQVLDPNFRAPYGNVNRWFITCINQPNFKKVLGEVKLCEKMATFDNKKYQELHPKNQKKENAKCDKPKEQKKAKEQKKEEPKPAEEPVKPKAKKPAEYFADAAPTNLNFDDLKVKFKNSSRAEFEKWLWENFDSNGYSLWYGEYNFTDEFKMDFLAANLCGGFLQRIEGLRKFAMATFCTYPLGNGYHGIKCVFILRGKKLIFEENEDWNIDAPSFTFRELSADKEEDRKLFCDISDGDLQENFKSFT